MNVSVSLFSFKGANASALEKEIGPEQFPVNEHYFGLVNVSVKAARHVLCECYVVDLMTPFPRCFCYCFSSLRFTKQ